VKAAVKAGKAQGSKIVSRQLDADDVDALQAQIDEMDDEIEEIMQEEKEEKQLAHVDMQIKKGENLIQHEAEIKGRPKRTWFESEHDKKKSKQAGRDELNGLRETMKMKTGKLSNKDKKRLDAKQMRSEGGGEWRKGKTSEAEMKARHKDAKAKNKASKGGDKDEAPSKPRGKSGGRGGRGGSRGRGGRGGRR
jgi:ATP-dependent RNA helicase DDX27